MTTPFARWLRDQMRGAQPGGMKQQDLAERVGVEQTMVSRWLRGLAVPTPENCAIVADLFGSKANHVWYLAGYLKEPPAEEEVANRAIEEAYSQIAQIVLKHINYRGPSTKVPPASNQILSDFGLPIASIMAASDSDRRPVLVYRVTSRPEVVATLTAPSVERQVGVMSTWVPYARDLDRPIYALLVEGGGLGAGFADGETLYVQPTREATPGGIVWSIGDHVIGTCDGRPVFGWVRDSSGGPVLVDDDSRAVVSMGEVTVAGVIVSRQRPERDRAGQAREVVNGGVV